MTRALCAAVLFMCLANLVKGAFTKGVFHFLEWDGCLVLLKGGSRFSPVRGVDGTVWSSLCSTPPVSSLLCADSMSKAAS